MKIIPVETSVLHLPLCRRATGELVLTGNQNNSDTPVQVFIEKTLLRYGIPPKGILFCVTSNGQFCQIQKTLRCGSSAVWICDTDVLYELDETDELILEPNRIKNDYHWSPITQTKDGRFFLNGYPVPLVYNYNDTGILGTGELFIHEKSREGLPGQLLDQHRYLMAWNQGKAVITTDRKAICLTYGRKPRVHWGNTRPKALDLCCENEYIFVLTTDGQVYYTPYCGTGWKHLCDDTVAFDCCHDSNNEELAVADPEGRIWLWHLEAADRKERFVREPFLEFPDKYISEIALSDRFAAVKFSDCSCSIYDRKRKQLYTLLPGQDLLLIQS